MVKSETWNANYAVGYVVLSSSTLEPICKVHIYKVFWHVRSGFGWSQSQILILASNPDIRSARFYGQFSLDKTRTLRTSGLECSSDSIWQSNANNISITWTLDRRITKNLAILAQEKSG